MPFKLLNNKAGDDWMASFIDRWKGELATRKPEILTSGGAKGLMLEDVEAVYELVKLSVGGEHDQL